MTTKRTITTEDGTTYGYSISSDDAAAIEDMEHALVAAMPQDALRKSFEDTRARIDDTISRAKQERRDLTREEELQMNIDFATCKLVAYRIEQQRAAQR